MNSAMRFIRYSVCCTVVAAAAMLVGCSKSAPESAFVSFINGDVTLSRGSDSHKVQMKETISAGDKIVTAASSFVMIQFAGGSIIQIDSNSTVELSTIMGNEKTLFLKEGAVLSKVTKLGKDEKYSVKTPVSIAAVRGTEFLTSYNGSEATIAVGDGKVNVEKIGDKEAKAVDKGSTAVVTQTVDLREVNTEEKIKLKMIEAAVFSPDAEKKSDEELDEIGKKILDLRSGSGDGSSVDGDDKSKSVKLSLSDIRKKYGRVDVIDLYSGQVIWGAIISRGAVYKVETTSGIISIDSAKIKRTASE
jgi:hypothetical protein